MHLLDKNSGKKLYSRTDILWSSSKLDDIEVVYPEGYDSLDWTKEPVESLEYLYKIRAQQLRDQYNYLILYYSGGSDSITALNAFIKNNIYLDEVVITVFSDIDDPKVDGKYGIEYLKKIGYKGKISVINLNYEVLDIINKKQLWYDLGYYTGLIHVLSRARITWFEKHNIIKSTNRAGNIAHIYGGSSPLIKVFNNKYYVELPASHLGMASYHIDNEQFFTTPKFPILHLKQCHIILNYWKKHFPNEIIVREGDYRIYKIVKKLIRDDFNDSISALKGTSDITSILKPNTESFSILNTYKSKDFLFFKTYIDSTIREFANTFQYKNNKGIFLDPVLNKSFYLSDTTL